jgi:hypothetical protein
VSNNSPHPPPIGTRLVRQRAGPGKTIFYMLLMGVICWWIGVQSYFFLLRIGLSPAAAHNLPIYTFVLGLAIGLGIGLLRSIKEVFTALLLMLVCGGVFWFFGVVIEGFLIAFGTPPDIASWVSRITFVLGLLIGSIAFWDLAQRLMDSRKIGKVHDSPRP